MRPVLPGHIHHSGAVQYTPGFNPRACEGATNSRRPQVIAGCFNLRVCKDASNWCSKRCLINDAKHGTLWNTPGGTRTRNDTEWKSGAFTNYATGARWPRCNLGQFFS